ncbi:MAG TPA: prohibitin family protein [Anaerolineaceae bacterium]|nr:prohibitin family protein [Anaerolineaceae bacterium]
MVLERVLNVVVAICWLFFVAFIVRFVVYTAMTEGIKTAVTKLFRTGTVYVIFLAAAAISLLNTSLVFIQPQEVGVVVSLANPNGYRPRPLRSGLHWIIPLAEEVHTYPISWQTYTMSAKPTEGAQKGDDSISARTSDGQEVIIDCTIIFQVDPGEATRIYVEWQDRYIDDLIRPMLRGLVRTYVSQYKVDEVNSSKRMDLENDLTKELKSTLGQKGFIMDDFLLRNIAFSKEYATAVERKQVALQDAVKKQYEAEQIQKLAAGEADRVRQLAQAEADALDMLGEALARNPDVITLRYVDKLAPNIQVMLVPNNAPYILPLPEMTPSAADGSTASTPAATATPDGSSSITDSFLPTPMASPTPTVTPTPAR